MSISMNSMEPSSDPRRGWSARAQELGVVELLEAYRRLSAAAGGPARRRTARAPLRVGPTTEDIPALDVPQDLTQVEDRLVAEKAGRSALELIQKTDPDPRIRDRAWLLLHPPPPRTLDRMPQWLAHPAFDLEHPEQVPFTYTVVLGEDEPRTVEDLVEAGLDIPGWSWLAGGPITGSGPWPRRRDGTPVAFLAQVDTRSLPLLHDWAALEHLGLPTSGFLQFFFDILDHDGLDQEDPSDSWHVRLVPHDQVARACGTGRRPECQEWPPGPAQEWAWPVTVVSLRQWPSLPSVWDMGFEQVIEALTLATTIGRRPGYKPYEYAALPEDPYSHMLGFPSVEIGPSMSDLVDFTWQYGRPVPPGEPRTRKQADRVDWIDTYGQGPDPWILLADFSGSRALEGWFGDSGWCEFWIRSSDLRSGSFDRAVAMVQGVG